MQKVLAVVFTAIASLVPLHLNAQCVSLTSINSAYTQDFDTLATAGTANDVLPAGWTLNETGGSARDNEQYAADTGASNTGDTYSYGSSGSSDRAFGGLLSGTLNPTIGACFTNNTGSEITALDVAYTGEQWRLGTAGRADRIDFQYSLDATSLTTGTWVDDNALDFSTPTTTVTGAKDGNAAANRTALSSTVTPATTIANGDTFWIRWTDFNASGADDGLAVDDFSLTPAGAAPAVPNLTINDVTAAEGDAGTTTFTFTVTLTQPAPAGGVTFDIATADGTATAGSDYVASTLTGQTIAAGNTTYTFDVSVNGDTSIESNETFFVNVTNVTNATVADGQGQGTIENDDVQTLTIAQIQGAGTATPYAGQDVRTSGVVTAVKSNGFFLQTPDASQDGDPTTSEGIFVFTSATPTVAVGDSVTVTGTATEFFDLTQVASSNAGVTVTSTGSPLPTPVILTTTILDPNGTPTGNLERFEGMLVAGNLTTEAPTNNNFGETATFLTGTTRPMREPGIPVSDPLPPGAPAGVPRFDENPEIIIIDTNALAGQTAIQYDALLDLGTITGPLDYNFGAYKLNATNPPPATSRTATAVRAGTADELTIASFNIENFGLGLGAGTYAQKIAKGSLVIRNVLNLPDIIGMVEVENQAALDALAAQVNADVVAAGGENPMYVGYLIESTAQSDPDQDVAFLVKTSRVNVVSVTQYAATETFTNPSTNNQDILHDRPPLVLEATIQRSPTDPVLAVTVMVNHLRSLIDIDADPGAGERVRAKRRAQAESIASLVETLRATNPNLVLVGDFNAFQFNDGYVDVIGTILGQPTPADQVTLASPDLVDPDLIDLINTLPVTERYSFIFENNPQALDHIIITPELLPLLNEFLIARNNADFLNLYRTDVTRPERISDHDIPVAYFALPIAANQAPVITVPPAQSTMENTTLIFSTATGNAIVIADPDAATGVVQVTLSVPSGTLTLGALTGLTFTTGDGTADATMTFSGTLADVNAALEGLQFTPAADYVGDASLTITVDDLGNTGSGGALTDTEVVVITVLATPPADADVMVTKTVVGSGQVAGGTVTWNIVARNNGPATATNVTITDILPAGTTLVSAIPTQGTCSGTTTVTCNLGSLADQATATVALTVSTGTNMSAVSNTATIAADQDDLTPGNGASSSQVILAPAAGATASVPTMTEWGLIGLTLLLLGTAVLRIRP